MSVTGFKVWDSGGITTLNAPTSSGCDLWDSGALFTYNPATGGGEEPVQKSSSDSLVLTLTETADVSSTISSSDTVTVTLNDSTNVNAESSGSDTLSLSLTETSSLSSSVGGNDTITLTLTEGTILNSQVSSTESLLLTIIEDDLLNCIINSIEGLSISISDESELQIDAMYIESSDNLVLYISNVSTLNSSITANDIMEPSLNEQTSVYHEPTSIDNLIVNVYEDSDVDVAVDVIFINAFDSLTLLLDDYYNLNVSCMTTDTLILSFIENSVLSASADSSDILDIVISEEAYIPFELSSSDEIVISILEESIVTSIEGYPNYRRWSTQINDRVKYDVKIQGVRSTWKVY